MDEQLDMFSKLKKNKDIEKKLKNIIFNILVKYIIPETPRSNRV